MVTMLFIIVLGPASLGFFSSRKAGKSMINMNEETPKNNTIKVIGFGTILIF